MRPHQFERAKTPRRLLAVFAVTLCAVALSAGSLAAAATVSVPPAVGVILPPNLNGFDLAEVGYEQSEYFLDGTANAYIQNSPQQADGTWSVQKADLTTTPPIRPGDYHSRVVVYRPIDPNKFNGTVIVEWLNVSGQVDADPDWTQTHNELIRDGFAWVGVSAQAIGLHQLTCSATAPPSNGCPGPGDPSRYGTRVHPGDSYSYDIFSQAGQAIRSNPQILGGLTPNKLIAAGESQSAGRMVTYIDAVQPLEHVYDGFLVHSRGAAGAALSQTTTNPATCFCTPPAAPSPTTVSAANPSKIRPDVGVPVFTFQTEFDVSGGFPARQPDTNVFRQWEAAGTSHFDTYGLLIGPSDTGDGQGAIANLAAMQNPTNVPGPGGLCAKPINTGGAHWLLNSAIYWLNQWVTNGTPPPIGQPLSIKTFSPPASFEYNKDASGNVQGGVRSPQVDVPIVVLAGIGNMADPSQQPPSPISAFCVLFGSTVPYTPTQMAALYKNHGKFVSGWSNDIQSLVTAGFLLPADGNELLNSAAQSNIGK